jgi:hypothetical protein
MTDARSPLAVKILSANPHAYEALVFDRPAPALAHQLLDQVQPSELLSAPAALPGAADAMLAGLWLWHDGLDECHRIVQKPSDEGDATFAFWHAIMHRREGDFSNSKYWYARAAEHPALQILAAQAGAVVNQAPADKTLLRLTAAGWNPNALVDLAQAVHGDEADTRHSIAVQLQRLEWKVLWDFCARS